MLLGWRTTLALDQQPANLIAVGCLAVALVGTALLTSRVASFRHPVLQATISLIGMLIALTAAVLIPSVAAGVRIVGVCAALLLAFAAVRALVNVRLGRAMRSRRPRRPGTRHEPAEVPDASAAPGVPRPFSPIETEASSRAPESKAAEEKVELSLEQLPRLIDAISDLVSEARRQPDAPFPRTLFLWVFAESPEGAALYAARQLGHVYLLRGGGSLAEGLPFDELFGDPSHHVEQTEEEVVARMATFDDHDDSKHSVNSMLCNDDVWTFGLDQLLAVTTAVVMDLTAFTPGRAGCEHELQVLVDRVPARRIVIVTGSGTDHHRLDSVLRTAWDSMSPGSPNRRDDAGQLTLARVEHPEALDPAADRLPPIIGGRRELTPWERDRAGLMQLLAAAADGVR